MSREVAITTIDNPFDPLDQFDDWFMYDNKMGYGSCGLLDRIAHTNNSLPEAANDAEIERAIDEIIMNDPTGLYIKVIHEKP